MPKRARIARRSGITAQLLFEEFNDELVILYAIDEANRMRYLMANETIGVERDKLRKLAIENLNRILPKIEMHQGGDIRNDDGRR